MTGHKVIAETGDAMTMRERINRAVFFAESGRTDAAVAELRSALTHLDLSRWHHARGDDWSDLGPTDQRLVPDSGPSHHWQGKE